MDPERRPPRLRARAPTTPRPSPPRPSCCRAAPGWTSGPTGSSRASGGRRPVRGARARRRAAAARAGRARRRGARRRGRGRARPRRRRPALLARPDARRACGRCHRRGAGDRRPGERGGLPRQRGGLPRALEAWTPSCGRPSTPIPADRRKMVTDHDAFGYLARRYGITVVGAAIPSVSTAAEASAHDTARAHRRDPRAARLGGVLRGQRRPGAGGAHRGRDRGDDLRRPLRRYPWARRTPTARPTST